LDNIDTIITSIRVDIDILMTCQIDITIFATMALYIAVAVVSLGLIGADAFSEAAIKTAAALEEKSPEF